MTSLLFATLLTLPIYPLNPVQQDTISYINLHMTAGLVGPGSVVKAGPEISAKYEMVIAHPFIIRSAIDFRYASITSNIYPDGDLRRWTFSAEGIYYRGINKLTGYVGLGLVWSTNSFTASQNDADSLREYVGVTGIELGDALGYRITAGLRLHKAYSIEIGVTDTRPKFIYTRRFSDTRYALSKEQVRFYDFRVSVGYLFNLKI